MDREVFYTSDLNPDIWYYSLSRMGTMRQALEHSDQWRNQDNDFSLLDLPAGPDSEQNKSHCSSHKEPDNTRFPFAEEVKHAPSLPRTKLASNSLAALWSRHTSKTYQILLLVAPEKVPALTGTQWHRSQRCTIRPDGYATIEFRIQCLSGIKRWLKHHAPCVQIIRAVSR
jgi:hypothetical protein